MCELISRQITLQPWRFGSFEPCVQAFCPRLANYWRTAAIKRRRATGNCWPAPQRPVLILRQPPVAHLRKAPQSLEHCKDMLHAGADLRLIAVLATLRLTNLTVRAACALIREVPGV